ncbi:MAG: hypothetical protein JW741_30275 [Sedimentisphaerales bacterium]|nr:hypothetical protein [Sedimentisphaerales bacterium]
MDVKLFLVVLVVVVAAVGMVAVLQLDTTGRSGSGLSDAFSYDLTELARVDPNLILYEEVGQPLSTGFALSRALALDSEGRIFVTGDKAIRILSPAGSLQRIIDVAGEPRCLTVADDDKVYVGVADHVEVWDDGGRRLASWEPLGEEAILTSIVKYNDSVFVADAGHRVVLHYDLAGNLIDFIGEKDPDRNIPGFVVPGPHMDVAVSRDGLLRVVNPGRHRIEAYTREGDLEFWWGEPSADIRGFCGCCNPVNFALLPNQGFVTSEKGLVRVKVYNSDGGFVGVVAGHEQLTDGVQAKICDTPEECQGAGLDVAADADGRIYILDPPKNVIRIFARKEARP